MSSFLVGQRTLDLAYTALHGPGGMSEAWGKVDTQDVMRKLNVKAFCVRYPGPGRSGTRYPDDVLGFRARTRKARVLDLGAPTVENVSATAKALACWQYQCSEGDTMSGPIGSITRRAESILAAALRELLGTGGAGKTDEQIARIACDTQAVGWGE